jgi:hypothetical protein
MLWTRSPRTTACEPVSRDRLESRPPGSALGITISRLRDGLIVEDYSAFDGLELLKQLGVWRTLLAASRMLRALRDGRRR